MGGPGGHTRNRFLPPIPSTRTVSKYEATPRGGPKVRPPASKITRELCNHLVDDKPCRNYTSPSNPCIRVHDSDDSWRRRLSPTHRNPVARINRESLTPSEQVLDDPSRR